MIIFVWTPFADTFLRADKKHEIQLGFISLVSISLEKFYSLLIYFDNPYSQIIFKQIVLFLKKKIKHKNSGILEVNYCKLNKQFS